MFGVGFGAGVEGGGDWGGVCVCGGACLGWLAGLEIGKINEKRSRANPARRSWG